MNRETKRRAVLGGVVAASVGGVSWALNRGGTRERGQWVRPVADISESPTWAYVSGVVDGDDRLDVEVAMRARSDDGRGIDLFADTDDPVGSYLPPLRSFWRFEVPVDGRPTGEYALRVGSETIPVEFVAESPPTRGAGVRLTPRVTWRSDYVAHARGYDTADGGRLHVAFRRPTGEGPTLDELALREPDGTVAGRWSVPSGVYGVTVDLDTLTVHEGDAYLVGYVDGREVDAVPLFYH